MERQPGFGPVLSSMVGLTNITGWPDRDPVNPYGAYTDFIVPRFAVASILAALDYRRRTGKGTHLDMSQLEASIHFSSPFLLDYIVNNREAVRMGNRDHGAAPHGAYPCAGEDRWIAIAVMNDPEWKALVRAMDNPTWADDPCFVTNEGRIVNQDDLDTHIGAWTATQNDYALTNLLQAAGVRAGVCQKPGDRVELDPQLSARGWWQTLPHSELGDSVHDGVSPRLSMTPGRLRTAAPLIGEHTREVLGSLLALTTAELDEYDAAGVFM